MIPQTGKMNVIAGGARSHKDGYGTNTGFYFPYGITIDADQNLWVCDTRNNALRVVQLKNNCKVETVCGEKFDLVSFFFFHLWN